MGNDYIRMKKNEGSRRPLYPYSFVLLNIKLMKYNIRLKNQQNVVHFMGIPQLLEYPLIVIQPL